jgi:hypothetical protein
MNWPTGYMPCSRGATRSLDYPVPTHWPAYRFLSALHEEITKSSVDSTI